MLSCVDNRLCASVMEAKTPALLIYKIQWDMASILNSTTANKVVTLSDDMALCGCQNIKFQTLLYQHAQTSPRLGFEFYPDKPIAMFTEESFCLFVLFVFLFLPKGK